MNTHFSNTETSTDFTSLDNYSYGGKLIRKTGNLLDLAEEGEFDLIIQGCNCFNTMGGGLAREIRERYPVAAEVDAETVSGDYTKLGNWTTSRTVPNEHGHWFAILNAYTQYNMSQGTDVFEYSAFQLILEKLIYLYGDKRIGVPRIGMGLAGGDEDVITAMIDWFASEVDKKGGSVTLVTFGG